MRNENLSRPAAFRDSGGDVDDIAKKVIGAFEAKAGMDADSDLQTFVPGQTLIVMKQKALNGDGGVNRSQWIGELRHHGISDRLDDNAPEFLDSACD